jgi:hypothetical protein
MLFFPFILKNFPLPPRFAISNVVKNLSIHHIRGVLAVNMGGVAGKFHNLKKQNGLTNSTSHQLATNYRFKNRKGKPLRSKRLCRIPREVLRYQNAKAIYSTYGQRVAYKESFRWLEKNID